MTIVVADKTFEDKKQAVTELAFTHYPVTVTANGTTKIFSSFDDARRFVEAQTER